MNKMFEFYRAINSLSVRKQNTVFKRRLSILLAAVLLVVVCVPGHVTATAPNSRAVIPDSVGRYNQLAGVCQDAEVTGELLGISGAFLKHIGFYKIRAGRFTPLLKAFKFIAEVGGKVSKDVFAPICKAGVADIRNKFRSAYQTVQLYGIGGVAVSPGVPVSDVFVKWKMIEHPLIIQEFYGGSWGNGSGAIVYDVYVQQAYYIGGPFWQTYSQTLYDRTLCPGYPTTGAYSSVYRGQRVLRQNFWGGSWGDYSLVIR